MVSITHYLYRKFALRAIAPMMAAFVLLQVAAGQQPHSRNREDPPAPVPSVTTKKAKRGPRAIAVVEFTPNGAIRLVPIALWVEGHYYDASLYGANPEPMALEPQTVYEAQNFGEPTGTFTVTMPKQVNGNWVADGTWQPQLAMDAQLKAKAAKESALRPPPTMSKVVLTGDANDGRPVLKRAPGSSGDPASSGQPASSTTSQPSSSTNGQPTPSSTTTSSGDSDRPTMKRPASDSSGKPTLGPSDDSSSSAPATTASTAKPQTTVDDHDPNRPVFKKTAPSTPSSNSGSEGSSSTAVTSASAASNDSDPNRPVLSHTKTAKPPVQASSDFPSSTTATKFSPVGKGSRAYPAISDAGQYESRSLIYSMSSTERQVQEQQLLKLGMDEIRAFATKHNGPAIPKTAFITDYDLRAFDLEYSSSPTVVLSARLPVASARVEAAGNLTYFVTIVARVDINDQAQKIFSMVTDSRHLDAYPRMELIDAIDADANGRGDLLFRQYSDTGISYGLYRVSPYQIEKIFEGGSSL